MRAQVWRLIAGLAVSLVISGCSSEDMPKGDPSKYLSPELRGYAAPESVIIGKDASAYWVRHVLSGYERTTGAEVPAKISRAASVTACGFTRPKADELVANVHVDNGGMPSSIYTFSQAAVAERATRWVNYYRNTGDENGTTSDPGGDRLNAIDVVVTDTTKPLYLVLQSEVGNTVWNIHAAPGVRIARAVMLGEGNMAVANLDPAVPLEVMNNTVLKQCRVTPAREPRDDWGFVENLKDSNPEVIAENRQRAADYSEWFKRNFGIASEQDVVGLFDAKHVLVGPLPASEDARVPFASLGGATVRLAGGDHFVATDVNGYRERHDKIVRDAVTKVVGDIKSIRPES